MNKYFKPIISSITGGVFIAVVSVLAGVQSGDFPMFFLTHGMAGFAGGYTAYFMFETTPSHKKRQVIQGIRKMQEIYARSNEIDSVSKITSLKEAEALLKEIY